MMILTFEHAEKTSRYAHEHVTLRFSPSGILWILTREQKRAVGARWEPIGLHGLHGPNSVQFCEDSFATRLAGEALAREGWSISGLRFDEGEWGEINILHCPEGLSNPDSIRGWIRDRHSRLHRPNKGEEGAYRFGRRFRTDVAAMRAAIEKRNP